MYHTISTLSKFDRVGISCIFLRHIGHSLLRSKHFTIQSLQKSCLQLNFQSFLRYEHIIHRKSSNGSSSSFIEFCVWESFRLLINQESNEPSLFTFISIFACIRTPQIVLPIGGFDLLEKNEKILDLGGRSVVTIEASRQLKFLEHAVHVM